MPGRDKIPLPNYNFSLYIIVSTRFWNNLHQVCLNQKIRKSFGASNPKDPKQDSQSGYGHHVYTS